MKKQNKKIKYALISVYDKSGIIELAKGIVAAGYQIISTGGTYKFLSEGGISAVPIKEITGNPEAFGGRMKTISFQVEGGILYNRSNPGDIREAEHLHVPRIDIVVCNLYPFAKTIEKKGVTLSEAVENIDVGGPTMIRSAAKNFAHVLVITDPEDYRLIIDKLETGGLNRVFRQKMAAKAFGHLAFYDSQINGYLGSEKNSDEITLPLKKRTVLRYGDNPDQKAGIYLIPHQKSWLWDLQRLSGRELSATNVTDIDAGIRAVQIFTEPAAVVVKHNNPCGMALGNSDSVSLVRALEADSESAFGGVVVMNKPMSFKSAEELALFKESGKGQMDIIAVPEIHPEALILLQQVRKTTGVYTFGHIPKADTTGQLIRFIAGGAVVQTVNNPESSFPDWETVTGSKPTKKQVEQMHIAWKFISRIRSNTVAVIDQTLPMTRGIGSGQTSRVLAVKIALERAGKYTKNGILASDSFFPFDDSVKLAVKYGIGAIVQQGGSIRDADSIKAANRAGIPMIFTHQRVFWH